MTFGVTGLGIALTAAALMAAAPASAQGWPNTPGLAPFAGSSGRVPGDINGLSLSIPRYPAATTRGTMRPEVEPLSALYWLIYQGHYLKPQSVPGNTFFPDSAYKVSCDDTLLLAPAETSGLKGAHPAYYACKLVDAPVVDMEWVSTNLDAEGYLYVVSYPFENHGNGRALVSWVKGCFVDGLSTQDGPDTLSRASQAAPNGGALYCFHGMARLEGAGWQNQFAPKTVTVNMGHGTSQSFYRPHGDLYDFGDKIAAWPQPYRSTGVVLARWGTAALQGMYAGQGTVARFYGIPSPWQDDWLGGTPPVRIPDMPAVGNGQPPPPVNVGAVGDGTAAGSGRPGTVDGRGMVGFDYGGFCNAAASNGTPRSPAWVARCLASQQ